MTVLEISAGDTAWVLVSAAMVLLMTPGLAFFYGGMVRAKSVLNMLMMSVTTMGIVGVLWVIVGYSMAFGNSIGGLIGNPLEFLFLEGLMDPERATFTIPAAVFAEKGGNVLYFGFSVPENLEELIQLKEKGNHES